MYLVMTCSKYWCVLQPRCDMKWKMGWFHGVLAWLRMGLVDGPVERVSGVPEHGIAPAPNLNAIKKMPVTEMPVILVFDGCRDHWSMNRLIVYKKSDTAACCLNRRWHNYRVVTSYDMRGQLPISYLILTMRYNCISLIYRCEIIPC